MSSTQKYVTTSLPSRTLFIKHIIEVLYQITNSRLVRLLFASVCLNCFILLQIFLKFIKPTKRVPVKLPFMSQGGSLSQSYSKNCTRSNTLRLTIIIFTGSIILCVRMTNCNHNYLQTETYYLIALLTSHPIRVKQPHFSTGPTRYLIKKPATNDICMYETRWTPKISESV